MNRTLDNSTISIEHLLAGLRWFFRVAESDQWNLTLEEQGWLLDVEPSELEVWKAQVERNESIELRKDVQLRLSYLLGILKGLKAIIPDGDPQLAYRWFHQPNQDELFDGASIKEYLLAEGTLEALLNVRNYLARATQGAFGLDD